ncbi:nickel-responsive transcriptional regulator NikR [Lujinxingia litoralis]|uniref:Putative nickel-responsive regulator n=1 Tax=Lujinxingia litoralis TaxID=2211119 RepID=A0A328C1A0_9DELT|nr:nickel-responsive transcriptional regulator NikR [Lujinxingia litoralis]RAL20069.1 nickel-responsive transcriptional regulator NikR [Lujinxingia litoralis]
MSELTRASIAVDAELMERFDRRIAEGGHSNRSEALRDLIRTHLAEDDWEQAEEAVATVTLLYDHHKRGLSKQVEDVGHVHHHSIIASMHVHLDADHCLEVVTLRGTPAELRHVSDHLIGLKGVLHGQAVFSAMPQALAEAP